MRRSARALGVLLVLGSHTGQGQGVTSSPPTPAPATPFKFPHVERRTLSNGLRLVVVENHTIPVVAGRIVLEADSLLPDPTGKEGLMQFTLAMLPEGTTTSSGDKIAERMAALGNEIFIGQQLPVPMNSQFQSPNDNMTFTVATADLAPALSLLGEMFSQPAFPSDAIERVRADEQAELRTLKTSTIINSGVHVPLRVFESLVRGGRPVRGATEAGIAAITRQDLVGFYSQYVRPQLATLILVGDVTAADAAARVEKAFGAWTRSGVERIAVDSSATRPSTTIYIVDRPGLRQNVIVVGTLGPPRTSPDKPAIDMMNALFDQSPTSRLGANIRTKHGFAYVAGQANTLPRAPAPMELVAYSTVAPAKTDSALIEWMSEIRGLATRPATEAEMVFARGLRFTSLPGSFETPTQVAYQVANTVARGAASFDDSYAAQIQAVTPADIAAAAAKYLDPAHLTIVIAGDRKLIEGPLRATNIAPVVVVDENGKPIP